ncbi:MAG: hypothetical protein ACLRWQ_08715 [Flavonifractor plautii]
MVANREHTGGRASYPLHTLSGIVSFSYSGASPALMGACAERGYLSGLLHAARAGSWPGSPGVAQATSCCAGPSTGRRTSPAPCCRIARSMILGKVLQRPLEHRAHPKRSRAPAG